MEITVGAPIVITDGKGLEQYGLNTGQKGWVNSLSTIPGQGSYVFFMPEDSKEVFVINRDRVEFDEERALLELDKDTIHKG